MILALLLVLATSQDVALQEKRGVALQERGGVTLRTLEGHTVDPFAGAKAAAFVFIHPDCPVSNRYAPELNRLHATYVARGVRFRVVYPGREDGEAAIRAHYADYGLRVPALLDPDFRLADLAGATMTPEAAVFIGSRLVYRGRIDDRAVRLGIWRPVAGARDLADVLARIDSGEALTFRSTQAVGCYIR